MNNTCGLNKNGLAMSFSNYKDIVIPKECVGFTEDVYKAFRNTAKERQSITVEKGNTKFEVIGNCLIDVKESKVVLGCKDSVIPDSAKVISIGECAFYNIGSKNQNEHTHIKIPNNIETIERYAFAYSGIKDIELPYRLLRIGDLAFLGTHIEEIAIPHETILGKGVFAGCNKLRKFIPASTLHYSIDEKTILENSTNKVVAVALSGGECHIPSNVEAVQALTFYKLNEGCYFDGGFTNIELEECKLSAKEQVTIKIYADDFTSPVDFAIRHGIEYETSDPSFEELLDRME